MSDKNSPDRGQLTRRNFLYVAAAGGTAAIGVSLIGPSAEAASKVSQKSVAYRPSPKGKDQCNKCALWQAPASCKVVAGKISPIGWCKIYAAKG